MQSSINPDLTINRGELTVGAASWGHVLVDNSSPGGIYSVNGRMTVRGPQEMASLSLLNQAVLTHSAATETQVYSVSLTVAQDVTIDATSKIDVSGMGYLPGRTVGNTTQGGATGNSGGSFGGLGGAGSGPTNSVYGDYANPNDLGSGGAGGAGGGLIRLEIGGTLQLDGAILANGRLSGYGGGSGGGIYVHTGVLLGTGPIRAEGAQGHGYNAASSGGDGGGGRIAIYSADYSAFNTENISASAGWASYSAHGGAGTVYLSDTNAGVSTLTIAGGGVATPLRLLSTAQPSVLLVRDSHVSLEFEPSFSSLHFSKKSAVQ